MHSPASDITLRLIPVKYIIIKAKSTENGMLNATTNVGLTDLRNRASTIIARIAPSRMLLRTLLRILVI